MSTYKVSTYKVGDRVRCIRSYQGGVQPGESGTVIGRNHDLLFVRWDEYSDIRHSCSYMCEKGHGWNVPRAYVVLERCESDFGILPVLDVSDLW